MDTFYATSPWVVYPFLVIANSILYHLFFQLKKIPDDWEELSLLSSLLLVCLLIGTTTLGFLYGGLLPGFCLLAFMPLKLIYSSQMGMLLSWVRALRLGNPSSARIEQILKRIRKQVNGHQVWRNVLDRAETFRGCIPDFHRQITELTVARTSLEVSMKELGIQARGGNEPHPHIQRIQAQHHYIGTRIENLQAKLREIELFMCLLQADTATKVSSDEGWRLLEEKSLTLMYEIEQEMVLVQRTDREVEQGTDEGAQKRRLGSATQAARGARS